MKRVLFLVIMAFCTISCDKWLDVRPYTEQKDKDQFSTEKGFYDALTGCYMSLAKQDVYGERLTMTNIESLANLWYIQEETTRHDDRDLAKHDYTTDYAKNGIKTIYAGLFNVIAQANMVIKYADEQGDVFVDKSVRDVVQGEAYAIRAYCQLDVLRLFGQLPQGGGRQVELPYSETTSIYEVPGYYDFASYTGKLKADLEKAELLLKDKDPVFDYTFDELNQAGVDNKNLMYRQSRLNYWAVKALQARMYLYLGEKDHAYRTAGEIIRAVGPDGNPVMEMSGLEDFAAGYRLCPSECLFYLSKYDVMTYSSAFLIGTTSNSVFLQTNQLVISNEMLSELYKGENVSSHNRYKNCWNKNIKNSWQALAYAATTKYCYDEEASGKMLYYQLVPMLRMSEVYLIAMETSKDLSEVNDWYKTYMLAHGVANSADFASLEEIKKFIMNEYRREFFAEGQMFYAYKRTGAGEMLWCPSPMTENEYVLPLPETEYNPNHVQK